LNKSKNISGCPTKKILFNLNLYSWEFIFKNELVLSKIEKVKWVARSTQKVKKIFF
jgi:hypothetical protein